METLPSSCTPSVSDFGSGNDRPIRLSDQLPNEGVLLTLPRTGDISRGQSVNELGKYLWVRIPTDLLDSSDIRKDRDITLRSHTDSSSVAQEIMVPSNPGSPSGSTFGVAKQTRPAFSTQRTSTPPRPREFGLSGVEVERRRLLEEGFSEEVVDTMQHSVRQSSSRCYNRMWKIFDNWCHSKQVNPRSAPLNQVLAFLQSLLNKGQAYRSIGVYRSAISKYHDLVDGYTVGQHPRVSKFMRGVFIKNPPSRTLLPAWDVNVILKFLKGHPFEPLNEASFQALTFKTVFLIALTSARRCSELQALSRSAPYTQFSSHGVRLRTMLGFLPKTANPSHLGEDIYLPVNGKDAKLCVVRCLRHYIRVSNAQMKIHKVKHDSLFVCYGHRNHCKPVKIRTISGWLVKIIKAAYAAAGKSLHAHVKAHSTRAQASSWALFKGASIEEVMRAADWRCQSTFISHYALDLWKSDSAIGNVLLS